MRHQDSQYIDMSQDELLTLEADIHDSEYRDAAVFGRERLKIDKDEFWRIHRRPYRSGAYVRGYRKRRLFELIDPATLSGKRVLDVGCGLGQHAVLCGLYGAQVAAIDISSVAIERARRIADANGVGDKCAFRVESVHDLTYESEKFDVVLCNAVLHHIWKYDGALGELYRVLRPSGRLFFAEGLRANPLYRTIRWMKRSISGERVKGDVDLELADLEGYAERFDSSYIEVYTLLSGIKNVIAGEYGSSVGVRGILWIAESIDAVLLRVPALQPMALEAVGYFEKSAVSDLE